jgi:hypothetical protein
MYEELRFRVTTDVCRLWPAGPGRDARLRMLDEIIDRAIEHAKSAANPRDMWSAAQLRLKAFPKAACGPILRHS